MFIGGSHDWGPGKLTDSQVGLWVVAGYELELASDTDPQEDMTTCLSHSWTSRWPGSRMP